MDLTFNPADIAATIPITQKGGYRNVVVKVITQGSLANGYRLSNISVNPPTVTVYSSDPAKVEALPGYVETTPINLGEFTTGYQYSGGSQPGGWNQPGWTAASHYPNRN